VESTGIKFHTELPTAAGTAVDGKSAGAAVVAAGSGGAAAGGGGAATGGDGAATGGGEAAIGGGGTAADTTNTPSVKSAIPLWLQLQAIRLENPYKDGILKDILDHEQSKADLRFGMPRRRCTTLLRASFFALAYYVGKYALTEGLGELRSRLLVRTKKFLHKLFLPILLQQTYHRSSSMVPLDLVNLQACGR